MSPLKSDNLSPLKRGASPRIDCRSMFSAEYPTATLSPIGDRLIRRDKLMEDARKSTQEVKLRGAPLPLVWVLVSDNIIPDYAVPFSEAYGGPQFIARAFLEVKSFSFLRDASSDISWGVGKAGTGMPSGALITYAGRQVTVKRYEVLCSAIEMRWNVSQGRDKFQQSSFIVSSTAQHSSKTEKEISTSLLLNSEILRVIPDDKKESYDHSVDKHLSPLTPVSPHVITSATLEEAAGRSKLFGPGSHLSMFPSHRKEDRVNEPFIFQSAPQTPQGHNCSRTCGCGALHIDSGNIDTSQINQASKLFPEAPSQSRSRTGSLSQMLSARLTSPRGKETIPEQWNTHRLLQNEHRATSPHTKSILSPINHFLLPETLAASATPTIGSPKRLALFTEDTIGRNLSDTESETYSNRFTNAQPSSAVRVSSPLTGRRELSGLGTSGPGYHRSSLHAKHRDDNRSLSDTESGSINRSALPTAVSPVTISGRTERIVDGTPQGRISAGSHELKPHMRHVPQDTLVQMPRPIHPSSPIWSIGQSLKGMKKESDDCEVVSTTFGVDGRSAVVEFDESRGQNRRAALGSELRSTPIVVSPGPPLRPSLVADFSTDVSTKSINRFQGDIPVRLRSPRSSVTGPLAAVSLGVDHQLSKSPPIRTALGSELRHSLVAESLADTSTGSTYRPKGDVSARVQSPSPRVAEPLVVASPRAGQHQPSESVPIKIAPLEVGSGAPRRRLSSNVELSGKLRTSSRGHDTPSKLEVAAVTTGISGSTSNESPVVSSSRPIADRSQEDRFTTRRSGFARGTNTTDIQERVDDLSDASKSVGPTTIATATLGGHLQRGRPEIDEQVSEELQRKDSWTIEARRGRANSPADPQCSSLKPHAMQRVAGCIDAGDRDHSYGSAQGTHVITGNETFRSPQGDLVQIQTSEWCEVFNDDANRNLSGPEKGGFSRSSDQNNDNETTEVAVARINSQSQADTKMVSNTSSLGDRMVREDLVMRESVPAILTKPLRVERGAASNLEVSRKVTASDQFSQDIPAHYPPGVDPSHIRDTAYRLGRSEDEESRRGEAGWDEKTHTMASTTRSKYTVPRSKHLETEDGVDVTSTERKEVDFRRDETSLPSGVAVEDRVVHEIKGQRKLNGNLVNKDKPTSSKQEGSVVSAVLAAACVAAVAYEAATESQHEKHSKHSDVLLEDRRNVAKDTAVNSTVCKTASSRSSKTTARVPTAPSLNKADTDIDRIRRSIDERSAQLETSDERKRVEHLDSRTDTLGVGARSDDCPDVSTGSMVVVSEEKLLSTEGNVIENVSLNQTRQQNFVGSEHAMLVSGKTQEERDAYKKMMYVTQAVASRERKMDAVVQGSSSTQDLSLSVGSEEHLETSRERDVLTCKTSSTKCEDGYLSACPSPSARSQEQTIVAVSPEVCAHVEQTSTNGTMRNDFAKFPESASDNQGVRRAEIVAVQSGTATSGSSEEVRDASSFSRIDLIQYDKTIESCTDESRQSFTETYVDRSHVSTLQTSPGTIQETQHTDVSTSSTMKIHMSGDTIEHISSVSALDDSKLVTTDIVASHVETTLDTIATNAIQETHPISQGLVPNSISPLEPPNIVIDDTWSSTHKDEVVVTTVIVTSASLLLFFSTTQANFAGRNEERPSSSVHDVDHEQHVASDTRELSRGLLLAGESSQSTGDASHGSIRSEEQTCLLDGNPPPQNESDNVGLSVTMAPLDGGRSPRLRRLPTLLPLDEEATTVTEVDARSISIVQDSHVTVGTSEDNRSTSGSITVSRPRDAPSLVLQPVTVLSTRDESPLTSGTELHGLLLQQLGHGQSRELEVVKEEYEAHESQGYTSVVENDGEISTEQRVEEDAVLSVQVSTKATMGKSVATIAVPSVSTADNSYSSTFNATVTSQVEKNDDEVHTEGISSAELTRCSSPSPVAASETRTTSDAARISGGDVVDACVIVAVAAAGLHLMDDIIHGDTSSMEVIQQQTTSESEASREVCDVHEQVISESATISVTRKDADQDASVSQQSLVEQEQVTSTSEQISSGSATVASNVLDSRSKSVLQERSALETETVQVRTSATSETSAIQVAEGTSASAHETHVSVSQQHLIGQEQVEQVASTSEHVSSGSVTVVSNVGLESRSESVLQERSALETETVQVRNSVTSETSTRQVAEDTSTSLCLDTTAHATENIQRSDSGDRSCQSSAGYWRGSLAEGTLPDPQLDSRPSSRAETPHLVLQSSCSSPGVICTSPLADVESEPGTPVVVETDDTCSFTRRDVETRQESAIDLRADSASEIVLERDQVQSRGEVEANDEQQAARMRVQYRGDLDTASGLGVGETASLGTHREAVAVIGEHQETIDATATSAGERAVDATSESTKRVSSTIRDELTTQQRTAVTTSDEIRDTSVHQVLDVSESGQQDTTGCRSSVALVSASASDTVMMDQTLTMQTDEKEAGWNSISETDAVLFDASPSPTSWRDGDVEHEAVGLERSASRVSVDRVRTSSHDDVERKTIVSEGQEEHTLESMAVVGSAQVGVFVTSVGEGVEMVSSSDETRELVVNDTRTTDQRIERDEQAQEFVDRTLLERDAYIAVDEASQVTRRQTANNEEMEREVIVSEEQEQDHVEHTTFALESTTIAVESNSRADSFKSATEERIRGVIVASAEEQSVKTVSSSDDTHVACTTDQRTQRVENEQEEERSVDCGVLECDAHVVASEEGQVSSETAVEACDVVASRRTEIQTSESDRSEHEEEIEETHTYDEVDVSTTLTLDGRTTDMATTDVQTAQHLDVAITTAEIHISKEDVVEDVSSTWALDDGSHHEAHGVFAASNDEIDTSLEALDVATTSTEIHTFEQDTVEDVSSHETHRVLTVSNGEIETSSEDAQTTRRLDVATTTEIHTFKQDVVEDVSSRLDENNDQKAHGAVNVTHEEEQTSEKRLRGETKDEDRDTLQSRSEGEEELAMTAGAALISGVASRLNGDAVTRTRAMSASDAITHQGIQTVFHHRVPSLDYLDGFKKEWVGVEPYDVAECGGLCRGLSRPLSLRAVRSVHEQSSQSIGDEHGLDGTGDVAVIHSEFDTSETHEDINGSADVQELSGEYGISDLQATHTEDVLEKDEEHPVDDATEDSAESSSASISPRIEPTVPLAGVVTGVYARPSLDYMEGFKTEWVVVEMYDIAERGGVCRTLSRSYPRRLVAHWEARMKHAEHQAWLGSILESKVLWRMMAWRIEVFIGASRWGYLARGWGHLTMRRIKTVSNRMADVIDHRLFVDGQCETMVRRTEKRGPIVVVIASPSGRPFDEDVLIAQMLSCVDIWQAVPQELVLLCGVERKTRAVVDALNEAMDVFQDAVVRYYGVEVLFPELYGLRLGIRATHISFESLTIDMQTVNTILVNNAGACGQSTCNCGDACKCKAGECKC
ncbi:hypothetical protein JVU11DRAFT_12673 [Chiua virens]|nr:hypothetical protein JVU11DRAFT_12673 [Chiua virens]